MTTATSTTVSPVSPDTAGYTLTFKDLIDSSLEKSIAPGLSPVTPNICNLMGICAQDDTMYVWVRKEIAGEDPEFEFCTARRSGTCLVILRDSVGSVNLYMDDPDESSEQYREFDGNLAVSLWHEPVVETLNPENIRGGSNPSQVYVEDPLSPDFKLTLMDVRQRAGDTVILNSITGEEMSFHQHGWVIDEGNDIRRRVYPKSVIQGLIDHYSFDFFENQATKFSEPDPSIQSAIDSLLSSTGLPPIAEVIKGFNSSSVEIQKLQQLIKEQETEKDRIVDELTQYKNKLASSSFVPPEITGATQLTDETSDLNIEGEVEWVSAIDIFKPPKRFHGMFNYEIPKWRWFVTNEDGTTTDVQHPFVPTATEEYIFRPHILLQVLWALVTNQKAWIAGHTGTGKSTLIYEIAARLNYPVLRVNFDSEITRMDLIGRETLRQENGTTVSEFVDGILPQAMAQPCILLCDEMDFIRPDVSYVFQRALEDEGLLITEDGGRLVKPDPMFRLVATANTQGQGDEFGYQGARTQSMAFLDRFTVWVEVDYLKPNEEKALIKTKVPTLSETRVTSIINYVKEHRQAFKSNDVQQPISPRGVLALAKAVCLFEGLYDDDKEGLKIALQTTILNKANLQDRSVLEGIADRTYYSSSDN